MCPPGTADSLAIREIEFHPIRRLHGLTAKGQQKPLAYSVQNTSMQNLYPAPRQNVSIFTTWRNGSSELKFFQHPDQSVDLFGRELTERVIFQGG